MPKLLKRIFKNPWFIRIGGGLLLFFITSVITALIDKKNIGNSIIDLFKTIITFIIDLFTFSIPVWVILIGIILVIVFNKIRNHIKNKALPAWVEYTEDTIRGWKFKWRYHKYNNSLINLRALCNNCSCKLLQRADYTSKTNYLHCPKCNSNYPFFDSQEKEEIKTIIIHNANEMTQPG